jgi:hypothetical protein
MCFLSEVGDRRIEDDEIQQIDPFAALEKVKKFYLKCENNAPSIVVNYPAWR